MADEAIDLLALAESISVEDEPCVCCDLRPYCKATKSACNLFLKYVDSKCYEKRDSSRNPSKDNYERLFND